MTAVQYNHLYLNSEKSDVVFVVEGTEIPAHRFILTQRSEYFRSMFSNNFFEANADKVTLKETNLVAFKRILEYFYVGDVSALYNKSLPIVDVFEILTCAQFYMIDEVASKAISYFKNINLLERLVEVCASIQYYPLYIDYDFMKNIISDVKLRGTVKPGLLLSHALDYSVDELISFCIQLLLKKVPDVVAKKIFDEMSPQAVKYVLNLRVETTETNIFDGLVDWIRSNPANSSSCHELMKQVELHLLDEKRLAMLFELVNPNDHSFYKNLISEQQEKAKMVQKVINQNVIDNLRIVERSKSQFGDKLSPIHYENYIVIDLRQQFLLNCLKFNFTAYYVSYTVSVSKNMHDWDRVIDHSKYDCFGPQVLYFNESAVRFIRIQSVRITSNIEALYSTDSFNIDPVTLLSIPKHNLMPMEMSYKWNCNSNDMVGGWICGEIVDGHVANPFGVGSIFTFTQPYIIGSMKLSLSEDRCSYSIEVSTDKVNWKHVFAEQNVSGWRTATFDKQPVMFIKITGTEEETLISQLLNLYPFTEAPSKKTTPWMDVFHLYKLECPAI